MKRLLRTFGAAMMFAGILTGCLAVLLLAIMMVRFPPLLIAVVLACWISVDCRQRHQASD
ncbi:hypothetical protein R4K19_22560 [Pseudomonas aeruginosa]|uniref:hypothetical protein n=1 Tax=Pseudomonas aeruginosa TaxID=287 RepID=UPI002953F1D7|nr:hypothetical protein [Pseudomonas aeruginosa]MDV8133794.1 hypothetical protein [Pseudomonas aeruginosa]